MINQKSLEEKYVEFLKKNYRLKESVLEAFADKIAREKQLEWWVNREEELEKWQKIIQSSVIQNKNFIVFIIGSYGRGKSLSLLKIINRAEEYKEIHPIYLSFKGEEKSKPGLDFMHRIFKSLDFPRLARKKTIQEIKNAIENIPSELNEPKNILKKIYFNENRNSKQLFVETENNFTTDQLSETGRLALYFLTGEIKPTASQLKKLGVLRKIDSIDITKEYLGAILCFLRNLKYKSLLLAIDEFESLFSLVSKPQQSIYLALLRSLYDFPSGINVDSLQISNMEFFIAISEDGWEKLQEMEKREIHQGGPIRPLMRRVDAVTPLGRFNKKQTRELIEKRLRYNRIIKKFEDDPLIPFKEDFVDYIYEKTQGEPSAIVVETGHVLEAGIADRISKITKEYAQEILEERGF